MTEPEQPEQPDRPEQPEQPAGGWGGDAAPELAELLAGLRVPDDLSGLLDGDIGTTGLPSQTNSVQVIAAIDPQPGAPYITTVQPSDDVAVVLPYDRAVRYGMAVLAAAHRAHYMAAVLAQARDILAGRPGRYGRPLVLTAEQEENARFLLGQLLEDLPELDGEATAPLRFLPVIHRDGTPMVRVSLPPHTEPFTGWTFPEACQHAHHVLGQAIVSQLDTAYRNTVAVNFGAGEQKGRAAVDDLGNFFAHPGGEAAQMEAARFVKPAPRVPGPPPGARPAGGRKRRRR